MAVRWGPMPAGDSSSDAVALAIPVASNTTSAAPMLDFSYAVPFSGGPLNGVRIAIGETCYFEVPIDRSRADDSSDPEEWDSTLEEAISRAIDASATEGTLYISGEVSEWLNLPDAVAADYGFQVRGDDNRWSPTEAGGRLTLCTEEDDCSPGGGGGGALASCSNQDACLELTGGEVAPFQTQCEGEGDGSIFRTGPCPSNGGGPTCLDATITSSGVRLPANVYWAADFCSRNPHIDTQTTCTADLGGTPSGTHCSPP